MSLAESTVRWGTLADVMRRLSVGRRIVLRLAEQGRIGTLRIERFPVRYSLDDADRIYESGLRPAQARTPDLELAMT